VACRRSSDYCARCLLALAVALSGCVTVKPQDKELLADPAMIYGAGGSASRHEVHVLDNRQGARSASGSGGGCGCN